MIRVFLFLIVSLFVPLPQGTASSSAYFIGNSLTRGLSLDRLGALADASGHSFHYGSQLSGGARLEEHWLLRRAFGERPWKMNFIESWGAYTSDHPEAAAFGNYRRALAPQHEGGPAHPFHAVVLQPFQAPIQSAPPHAGDRDSINRFIAFAARLEPQPRFFIYATWPHLQGIVQRGHDPNGDGIPSFDEFFQQPHRIVNGDIRSSVPTAGFFHNLLLAVNDDNPHLKSPVDLIPAGHVLAALDRRIRRGTLPGIQDYFRRNADYFHEARLNGKASLKDAGFLAFDPGDHAFLPQFGVLNFYADNIHLNDQPHNDARSGTIGAYAAAATMHAVLFNTPPGAISPSDVARIYSSFHPHHDVELILAIQEAVADTLAQH